MIGLLFDKQEATIAEMAEAVNLSEQAVRYNLKKFEELAIVERLSEKIRDRNALYRFKSG
jgi:DNA-binding Lrp family transcriptional regulator